MIRTFAQVEKALESYVITSAHSKDSDYSVDRPWRLAEYVGSPEKRLRIIHVAGTSGKTSTCYYLRALLEAAGQKTGMTVSPHMINIADRVQVGGVPLEREAFCRYLDEYLKLIKGCGFDPSYFEVMMVFALWVFEREKVDYAIIETGLGGMHDSSNICRRPDKVCVLTDIGYDHMSVLGESLAEIAKQKVGIVHPGNHLLSYPQVKEVMKVVNRVDNLELVHPPETKDYRERNFELAHATYKWLKKRDKLPALTKAVVQKCRATQVPGRLEVFKHGGATIVLDGAHNRQKMAAMIKTFNDQFAGKKPLVVLAMKQGKEYEKTIGLLKPFTSHVIATEYTTFQDISIGAISAGLLAAECDGHGISVDIERDILQAVAYAQSHNELVLVTGSLYAVSEVRQMLIMAGE